MLLILVSALFTSSYASGPSGFCDACSLAGCKCDLEHFRCTACNEPKPPHHGDICKRCEESGCKCSLDGLACNCGGNPMPGPPLPHPPFPVPGGDPSGSWLLIDTFMGPETVYFVEAEAKNTGAHSESDKVLRFFETTSPYVPTPFNMARNFFTFYPMVRMEMFSSVES